MILFTEIHVFQNVAVRLLENWYILSPNLKCAYLQKFMYMYFVSKFKHVDVPIHKKCMIWNKTLQTGYSYFRSHLTLRSTSQRSRSEGKLKNEDPEVTLCLELLSLVSVFMHRDQERKVCKWQLKIVSLATFWQSWVDMYMYT